MNKVPDRSDAQLDGRGSVAGVPRLLIAAAVRRTRAIVWRGRARLHRRIILLAHPQIECGAGVTIDPTAIVGASDGGTIVIGAGTVIAARATILAEGGALRIGSDCHIGIGTTIHVKAGVEIGDDALIAQYVAIRDHDHATADPGMPYRSQGFVPAPVRVGRNAWLGVKVTVLKGARIGDGAVIGANAVVTGSIEPGIVGIGVPARPLRRVHP
jgi:carbonic anhydrase/acetyltransferase-like protein (isoleucine patch superfamily)